MNNKPKTSWPLRILVGTNPRRTLIRTLILAILAAVFFKFMVRPIMIDGASMEPTIRDRSFRFVNLLAYWNTRPERGDVVVIEKDGFDTMYLKRVIGLPGETVRFTEGKLYVNKRKMPEPYLQSKGDWDMREIPLGKNQYLVAGDNRAIDRRQHIMGIVEQRHILGRLLGR